MLPRVWSSGRSGKVAKCGWTTEQPAKEAAEARAALRFVVEPALFLCQQPLPRSLQPFLEAAGDRAEDTGQLNFHGYHSVEHVNDTRDRLTHRRDAESESVVIPALGADPAAAGRQIENLRETRFDTTARLDATELMRNADDEGRRHALRVPRIGTLGKGLQEDPRSITRPERRFSGMIAGPMPASTALLSTRPN